MLPQIPVRSAQRNGRRARLAAVFVLVFVSAFAIALFVARGRALNNAPPDPTSRLTQSWQTTICDLLLSERSHIMSLTRAAPAAIARGIFRRLALASMQASKSACAQ
jgi:hypothetical protein